MSFDGDHVVAKENFQFTSWNLESGSYKGPLERVVTGINVSYLLKDECRSLVTHPWQISNNCIRDVKSNSSKVQSLRLCRAMPDDRSLNTASASVLYSLNMGLSTLERRREVYDNLDKFEVLLFPEFRYISSFPKSQYESVLTDNASWSKISSSTKKVFRITVLPTSTRWVKSGSLALWKSPFVINHELGHHLFYSILPEAIKRAGFFDNEENIHDYHQLVDQKLAKFTGHIKNNYLEFASINEAVADLFAFIVLGEKQRDLAKIYCGLSYRSVDSDLFPGGFEKSFNEELEGDGECFEPNGSDPHLWGAIIANSTYKFLQENVSSEDSLEDLFFQLLGIYKDILNSNVILEKKNEGLKNFVQALLKLGEKNSITQQECNIVNQTYSKSYREIFLSHCG